jgi:hypothetical protein
MAERCGLRVFSSRLTRAWALDRVQPDRPCVWVAP